MASKKSTKGNPLADTGAAIPEGYQKINNEQSNAWIKPEEGTIVEGEVLGRFRLKKISKDNKIRWYYQIRLFKALSGVVARKVEGDTEMGDADVGEIVNVDEKSALECLAAQCVPGKRVQAWICYRTKEDIGDGQTFWRIDVGAKPMIEE